ncbi:hypothetical protein DIPPA_25361 [Diplonema papillatum]|nr:hypothetical protein DIPPA_25361 [Diplonema papillatum]
MVAGKRGRQAKDSESSEDEDDATAENLEETDEEESEDDDPLAVMSDGGNEVTCPFCSASFKADKDIPRAERLPLKYLLTSHILSEHPEGEEGTPSHPDAAAGPASDVEEIIVDAPAAKAAAPRKSASAPPIPDEGNEQPPPAADANGKPNTGGGAENAGPSTPVKVAALQASASGSPSVSQYDGPAPQQPPNRAVGPGTKESDEASEDDELPPVTVLKAMPNLPAPDALPPRSGSPSVSQIDPHPAPAALQASMANWTVTILHLGAPPLKVAVPPSVVVEDLLAFLAVDKGQPLEKARLIHAGKELKDLQRPVSEVLPDGAKVHYIVRYSNEKDTEAAKAKVIATAERVGQFITTERGEAACSSPPPPPPAARAPLKIAKDPAVEAKRKQQEKKDAAAQKKKAAAQKKEEAAKKKKDEAAGQGKSPQPGKRKRPEATSSTTAEPAAKKKPAGDGEAPAPDVQMKNDPAAQPQPPSSGAARTESQPEAAAAGADGAAGPVGTPVASAAAPAGELLATQAAPTQPVGDARTQSVRDKVVEKLTSAMTAGGPAASHDDAAIAKAIEDLVWQLRGSQLAGPYRKHMKGLFQMENSPVATRLRSGEISPADVVKLHPEAFGAL